MTDRFSPPLEVGFIGLGRMGAPMARCLAGAGYSLHVFDADGGAVDRFAAATACAPAADLRSLGAAARVVITMLPAGDAVRRVLLGEGGDEDCVAAGLAPGSVLIDMTSAAPAGTVALGTDLAARGFPLIDAPVSGGVAKAAEGTLAIMAGGAADQIDRCRPVLAAMGTVFPTGGSGTGHAMKALNNYLSAATLAASAEAIIAGTRFGLDPARMVEILNASTGRSSATEDKYPRFVLPGSFDSGFALALMAKDLRLALDLAHGQGTPARLLETLSATYEAAAEALGPDADNTEVVRYLETLADKQGQA